MKRLINQILEVIWWIYTTPRRHDVERRSSIKYKKKKEIVKNIWIVVGSVMAGLLQFPFWFGLVLILFITTIILSFMILDETEDIEG